MFLLFEIIVLTSIITSEKKLRTVEAKLDQSQKEVVQLTDDLQQIRVSESNLQK